MGAFVLPNSQIPDGADLRHYIVPGELNPTLLIVRGEQLVEAIKSRQSNEQQDCSFSMRNSRVDRSSFAQ